MIKTIIFDLSEVLLQGAVGISNQLKKTLGDSITDSMLLTAELSELFTGQINEDEYWARVIKSNSLNITSEILKTAVRKNFKEIKETRKIIEALNCNYKLGLLSNHAKEWIEYCEETFDYKKLFDGILYSFESGVTKPDKESFLLILKILKSKPEETLYIDDYLKNTNAAQELGLNTIHFISPEDLKNQLRKFKIKL